MPRLSRLSNPTDLVEIDRERVSIMVDEGASGLYFSLARLDLTELPLKSPLDVIVVASRGNTEERLTLGPTDCWDKSFRRLDEIGTEGTLTFRVLLVPPGSARLAAAAENIRPTGQGESSSFIALEPADLGEVPWEILILELEGRAVIRFNKKIFVSSAAAESDKTFTSLVLPEAVRTIARWIAANTGALDDEHWRPFGDWLVLHGITEEAEADSQNDQDEWVRKVVFAFCERFKFASELATNSAKGFEE